RERRHLEIERHGDPQLELEEVREQVEIVLNGLRQRVLHASQFTGHDEERADGDPMPPPTIDDVSVPKVTPPRPRRTPRWAGAQTAAPRTRTGMPAQGSRFLIAPPGGPAGGGGGSLPARTSSSFAPSVSSAFPSSATP